MTAAIVDASAVVAWLLPSQATAASIGFEARIAEFDFEAPFIFEWEVHNVLLRVFGRRPMSAAYDAALRDLSDFKVALGVPASPLSVLPLARAEGLSLFDACYLDQALRRNVALISRDKALVAAAQRQGVVVHDLL